MDLSSIHLFNRCILLLSKVCVETCDIPELLVQDFSNRFYRRRLRHLIVFAVDGMGFQFAADVRLPGAGQAVLAFLNVGKKEQNVTVIMAGPEFLLQD
jgi:hypothetical protein